MTDERMAYFTASELELMLGIVSAVGHGQTVIVMRNQRKMLQAIEAKLAQARKELGESD